LGEGLRIEEKEERKDKSYRGKVKGKLLEKVKKINY